MCKAVYLKVVDLSKAVLHLWIIYVVRHAFLSFHCSLVVTCWKWANLLALLYVMFSCVLSLSHVVSFLGVVLDCIDSLSLPSYLLLIRQPFYPYESQRKLRKSREIKFNNNRRSLTNYQIMS